MEKPANLAKAAEHCLKGKKSVYINIRYTPMCMSSYYWMQVLLHVIIEHDSPFCFLFNQNYITVSSTHRNASAGDELKRRKDLYMDGVLETNN